MCLGIPGRIVEVWGEGLSRTGKVDFGGVRKEANLAFVPDANAGDYVIIHVGFAITMVNESEAQRTLEVLRAMDEQLLATELGIKPVAPS